MDEKRSILAEPATERERPPVGDTGTFHAAQTHILIVLLQNLDEPRIPVHLGLRSEPDDPCFQAGTSVPLTVWRGVPYSRESTEIAWDGCFSIPVKLWVLP